jgi:DNA-directed RNA polymerase
MISIGFKLGELLINEDLISIVNLNSIISSYSKETNQSIVIPGKKFRNVLRNISAIAPHLSLGNSEGLTEVELANIKNSYFPLNLPAKVPMIVIPKKYERKNGIDVLGGYLLNDLEYASPLITRNPLLKQNSSVEIKNSIFNMVNNLSSVPYKINKKVLNFILENGVKYGILLDQNNHPMAGLSKKKKKLSLKLSNELSRYNSLLTLETNVLALANIYQDIEKFYIPVMLDFRGRVYCETNYLNYQGSELAKCLLLFANPAKVSKSNIEAINNLKIHGANLYGNGLGRKSFEKRIE